MLHRKHVSGLHLKLTFLHAMVAVISIVSSERRGFARDAASGVAGGCITNKSHRDG
jgi:hypothetical protein